MTLCGCSGNDFLSQLQSTASMPEMVLLDLQMQDGNGIDVLKVLKETCFPLKYIVYTSGYKAEYTGQILKLGGHAFIGKDIDRFALLHVLREVHTKGHFWTPEQMQVLGNQLSSKVPQVPTGRGSDLSKRELEVLALLCQQFSTREIAEEMFLSVKTVETHKTNLLLKTGVRNSLGLVLFAIQSQLVNPAEIMLLEK